MIFRWKEKREEKEKIRKYKPDREAKRDQKKVSEISKCRVRDEGSENNG